MVAGYNIQCDAGGGLYYQTCYVIDASGNRNEILGYTDNGGIITKTKSNSPGIAWTPQLFTLNNAGQQFQPYRGGNIPYGYMGSFTPATSADPQDLEYMYYEMPGSQSFRKQQTYVAGWWENVFGLRQEAPPKSLQSSSAETETEIPPNQEDTSNPTSSVDSNLTKNLGYSTIGVIGLYLISKSMFK